MTMPTAPKEMIEIVGRVRRVGWPVETGNGRQDWAYRVTMPNGERVQLHRSPSDRQWRNVVMRALNAGGFDEAERQWLADQEADRKARIGADRKAAEAKVQRAKRTAAAVRAAAGPYAGPELIDMSWALARHQAPEARFVLIGPDEAKAILDIANTHNRLLKSWRVDDDLAPVIRRGDWGLTHQGIAFDWNGVLQDGQGRLAAIVAAGKTVPILVVVGMNPDNFRKIDLGTRRSARDAAGMRGVPNATVAVAATRMLIYIDDYGPDAHVQKRMIITVDRIDRAMIKWHDELQEAIRHTNQIRRDLKKINPAGTVAAIFSIRRVLPEGDPRAEAFLEDLTVGADLSRTDPVLSLRRIVRNQGSGFQRRTAWETYAYIVKTWNARMTGRTPKYLVFRTNEPLPAPFVPPPLDTKPGEG